MTQKNSSYDASSIRILEGLDPVRLRPGQFTRTDCPLHLIQEVLDNAVDEALAGFATRIEIRLEPDGFIAIIDNGRGIPVDIHPEKQIPVIQAIFTVLYSGGKFDKKEGGAYGFSGGLHGVGVSVTNALSSVLIAEVVRKGSLYRITFNNGDVAEPVKKVGKAEGQGTSIRVQPNPKYFDSPDVPVKELKALLKSKAVLLTGLTTVFVDARDPEDVKTEEFAYTNGMVDFLAEESGDLQPVVPVLSGSAYVLEDSDTLSKGEGAEWAFSWYDGTHGEGSSYVNLIPTPLGGTHVGGLRQALFNTVRTFIERHSMMPKGLKMTADDVFKNVRFCLSTRLLDPGFDNQTKDRLNTREAVRLLEEVFSPSMEAWLNQNPGLARTVADIALRNATSRQKAATKTERRKQSSVVMLPGKLSDCESTDANVTELFLVEGDSAGGSAKQARARDFQAVLPLRGKGLNSWEVSKADALRNTEIHDISIALGIPPHSIDEELDWSKLRYGKLCILADADVDGAHIQTLLLTLFLKHFPQLIDRGHIYVAKPPLFSLDVEDAGAKRAAKKKMYAMDRAELLSFEERLRKEGYSRLKVGRFKGLGEMDPPELWDTTLNPETRRLLKVMLPEALKPNAVETFNNLMAKSNASWRKDFIERRGDEVEAD